MSGSVLPQAPPPPAGRQLRVAVGLVVLLLLVVGGELVAINRHSSGPSYVITPAKAQQILNAYWPRHEQALVDRDLSALATMEAGPAKTWEQAEIECGCLHVDSPRTMLSSQVLVPMQTRYPANFIAEADWQLNGAYWIETMVFTEQQAHAPWMVTEDSGYGPPAGQAPSYLGFPGAGHGTFTDSVDSQDRALAAQVVQQWARVWQRTKDSGRIPVRSAFNIDTHVRETLAELASHRQDTIQPGGANGHFRFYVSPTDALVVEWTSAGLFTCQPIRESVVYTAPGGGPLVQDSALQPWGPFVPPGDYSSVVGNGVWQTCFIVRPRPFLPTLVLYPGGGGIVLTPGTTTA